MITVAISFRKHLLWTVLVLLIQGRSTELVAQQIPERYQAIPGDSLSLTSIDVAALRSRKDLEIVPRGNSFGNRKARAGNRSAVNIQYRHSRRHAEH